MAGLSVSAGTARARRAVIRHFTEHAATDSERAVEYEPTGRLERRMFRQMLDAGAIRQASPGRFYVEAGRLAVFRAGVRRRVVRVALISGVLAASVVAIVT